MVSWPQRQYRQRASRPRPLLNRSPHARPHALQGVIAAGLLRSWAVLRAADVFFLAAYAAATAGMLAWRRLSPASFAAWRELPAAAMRLSVAAAPAGWVVTRQALSGAPPFATDGGGLAAAQNAAAFALLLVFSSFGATGSVLVRARPPEMDRASVCSTARPLQHLAYPCLLYRQGMPPAAKGCCKL